MVNKILIAFVGMPGSGKTEAVSFLQKKGFPTVRFGDLTEEKLQEQNLAITPENEKIAREALRQEYGMAAYAVKSKPKIDVMFVQHETVIVDGLYSWEEYLFLTEAYENMFVICVYTQRLVRYDRLAKRQVRPLTHDQAEARDRAEIENLNKGGPIAMADYMLENNSDKKETLYKKIDELLDHLDIKV